MGQARRRKELLKGFYGTAEGSNSPAFKRMSCGYMSDREIDRFKDSLKMKDRAHYIVGELAGNLYFMEVAIVSTIHNLNAPFLVHGILGKDGPDEKPWLHTGVEPPFKGRRRDIDNFDVAEYIMEKLIDPGSVIDKEKGLVFLIDRARNQQLTTTGGHDS
jgi:hypothetical protein